MIKKISIYSNLIKYSFASLFIGIILSGCISLPTGKNDGVRIFYLPSSPLKQSDLNQIRSVPWQLTIEEPTASERLDSDHLVVDMGGGEVSHVKDIRWVERLPVLLHQLVLDIFEESGKLGGVGDSVKGLDAQYILLLDFGNFEFVVAQKEVKIRVKAKLMNTREREVVAAQTFTRILKTPSESSQEVTEALIKGMNEIAADLLKWTLETPKKPSLKKVNISQGSPRGGA